MGFAVVKRMTKRPTENEDAESDELAIHPVFAQHGPPTNVKFRNVLAHDLRSRHPTVPAECQAHPLVRGQFFYTIPPQLLQKVFEGEVGEALEFDRDLYDLECKLSVVSGDHCYRVGFWQNWPIKSVLMGQPSLCREDLTELGVSETEAELTVKAANKHSSSFDEIGGAYSGWLMTNTVFLDEMDVLLEKFGEQMLRWGTSLVGLPILSSIEPGQLNPTSEEGWQEYDAAVLEFCVRWRLQGLAGPRLPIPMKPMISGQFPITIVKQLMRAGGVFNWPDTFPLFARDVLRDMIADALRPSSDTQHLEGWHKIIDVRNKAKNQFASLERRFRFQHFWRLLRQRHPSIFSRRTARVERAFAEFFGVTESSMHADRMAIQKALGKDWDLRAELA